MVLGGKGEGLSGDKIPGGAYLRWFFIGNSRVWGYLDGVVLSCGLSGMVGSAGIGPAGLREIGGDGFSGWLADRPVVMPVGGGLLRERQRPWSIAGFWQGMGIPVNGVMPAQERVSAISLGWLECWS